jgi:glycosyltransferase involved in cell wall biosynthesis
VSAYVAARRGRDDDVFVATQAASALHSAPAERAARADERLQFLFVGRFEREKGVDVLLEAWRRSGLEREAELVFVGDGPLRARIAGAGVTTLGRVEQRDLPALYAAADALVLPSIATATFREPWGLVANEAMHQGTAIVASDAVGAVAGGLVRDGRNGLVFPAGDSEALSTRLLSLARNADLRRSLGEAARADVAPYTPEAWARGMSHALAAVGESRSC